MSAGTSTDTTDPTEPVSRREAMLAKIASLHEEQAQWSGIGRTLQLRTEPAVLPLGNPDG